MNRTCLAAVVVVFSLANLVVAQQPRKDEHVRWTPTRNVKDAIGQEIDRFEKDLKAKLGPKVLASTPYTGGPLKAITLEQIVDRRLKELRKEADHDNQKFMPVFATFRRTPATGGCDLLSAPAEMLAPLGWRSGSITFKFVWEKVDGRFTNNWDHNDVDEEYEVVLNATLTLGIDLTEGDEAKRTIISHSVTKPIVQGWRTTLVASEGQVSKIIEAPR